MGRRSGAAGRLPLGARALVAVGAPALAPVAAGLALAQATGRPGLVAASLAAGLLAGCLGALLFGRYVARRTRAIGAAVSGLVRGEPAPAPAVTPGDELGDLAERVRGAAGVLAERQRQLDEVRAFLQRVIERSPAVVFRLRPDDLAVTYVGPNLERVLGLPADDALSDPGFWTGRVHPADRAVLEEQAEAAWASRSGFAPAAYRFRHADGSWRWLETTLTLEGEPGEDAFLLGFALDVTARRAAEAALGERERLLSAILATSPDAVAILDERGRRRYVSPSVKALLGYDPGELAETGVEPTHPDDLRLASEMLGRALRGGQASARYRMIRRDGSPVWVEVRAAPFGDPEERQVLVVMREVSAQVHLEQELRAARDEAERSSRAKSEFLSRMSHELRTPLNAILGFAQLLEMGRLTPEQADAVGEILNAGRHLLDLINEVLDISRIESGRAALSIEPVDLDEVVRESVALVRPLAAERGIELRVPSGQGVHARADRQRLTQVLLNLLSNAVKYNRPRGWVEVRVETGPRSARVAVRDSGPGIAASDLERLFVPFERLGEHAGIEGTGLGLALSRSLMRAMGGTLSVRSTPGAGAEFAVELEAAEPPASGLPTARAGTRQPLARPAGAGGRTAKVVYVEDNLSNLRLVEHLLGLRGATVVPAMQGSLGVELVRDHLPDLVLLDLNLPDLSGLEVLARLRAHPKTARIPVVVVSADATPGQVERLLEAGAFAYLTKPLEVQRFLAGVDEAIAAGGNGRLGADVT